MFFRLYFVIILNVAKIDIFLVKTKKNLKFWVESALSEFYLKITFKAIKKYNVLRLM
jgi:hypothetical protein